MATQRCSSIKSLRKARSPVARQRRNRVSAVSSGSSDFAASASGSASRCGSGSSDRGSGAGSAIAIQISPLLVQTHTDLTVVGVELEVIDDNTEDLPAECESLRLERGDTGGRRCSENRHFALTEVEAEQQCAAVAAFDQRSAQFVDRDA